MLIVTIIYLCLVAFLVHYFHTHDKGPKEPAIALGVAAVFGLLGLFAAQYLEATFITEQGKAALGSHTGGTTNSAITALLTASFIEELLKFAPLAIWLWRKSYLNEVTDGIIYFGLAGLFFGAMENYLYAVRFGAEIGLFRALITPFLHVGFSCLIGWSLARYKTTHRQPLLIAVCFGATVLAHAIYNLLLFSRSGPLVMAGLVVALCVNLLVFVLYRIAQNTDRAIGISK